MTSPLATADIGTAFEGRVRELTLDRILAFSGGFLSEPNWPHKNLHTDLAKAQEAGLPDLIASGNHSVGILVEFLIQLFGITWLSQGVLDMKIVNSAYAGDTIQARATLTKRLEVDGRLDITLDMQCLDQNGTTIIAGTATCPFEVTS